MVREGKGKEGKTAETTKQIACTSIVTVSHGVEHKVDLFLYPQMYVAL